MKYRNINTGEIWTLEEIKEAYEQFKHETSLSFEETMEDFQESYWYAVLRNKEDDDWGTGSYSLDEAKEMAENYGEDAYIAVISEEANPVCVEEIYQEDF